MSDAIPAERLERLERVGSPLLAEAESCWPTLVMELGRRDYAAEELNEKLREAYREGVVAALADVEALIDDEVYECTCRDGGDN